ncbi:MAG: DNA repair exonuclease [SAR324 cluster bacterium]|nr:DNA repair exonuclease [SAR324 cluster bacterium]
MRPPLRIAHASDIHLDTDYHEGDTNLGLRDYYRGVFDDLLRAIVGHAPELMLLPGDLFDSNRASPDTVIWAAERLASLPFPVAMIPGNHDCLDEGAIYTRFDFDRPPGLHFIGAADGERRRLAELPVNVWGRGMIQHHPKFQPLAKTPEPEPGRWNLGLGHGIYTGSEGNDYRSSPIGASEIAESGFDYLALGHHHALLDVSQGDTGAYFSGAPVPISPDRKGTYLIVELAEGRPPTVTIHHLDRSRSGSS